MSTTKHDNALITRIRRVLLENWDPVGVGDNPNLRDEYDAYIPELIRILSDKSVVKQHIFSYLQGIEIDRMGIPEDPERIEIAAGRLLEIAGEHT
ncbi:MAG: hypothetical protein HC850_09410 [Rhodomicrobium sp.]|nr:hypothetical protein [Rhodomicrobium sp.]